MSQIVVETDTIKKAVLYFFAIAGIAIIGCMVGMSIVDRYSSLQAEQTVIPEAAPDTIPEPTVAQTVYPTIIEFTVLSTTVANGHYSVYTTAGQTLYMPDFYSWNHLLPRDTYSATITGAEANGALDVATVNRVASRITVPSLKGGVQRSAYPYVLEFTVRSTSSAYGHYSVYTTTGQTLYVPDIYSWNSLVPENIYSATITGTEVNGALDVGTLNFNSQGSSPTVPDPVSGAMALPQTWTLRGSSHTGTVTLYPDDTGSATIDSYPTISFLYTMDADDTEGTASYRLWSVPFTYDPINKVITSPNYPGAELVPTI
ncbi:hypothetical protein [Methanoregula sp.]|uniref:hypothetical protein n=1 Tax=Methanoregula sp. TaxID=2052170 RepID=UPI0035688D49